MKSLNKNYIVNLLKISTAVALVYWLIDTGKLDFNALSILWKTPSLLCITCSFWLIGAVFLCALRWQSLVQGMQYSLSLAQAIRLNLIGIFFNTVMPGVVGGDLVKAIYVCKGQKRSDKMSVFLTILLDRIIGLVALFFISLVAILLNWNSIFGNPILRPFVFVVLILFVSIIFFALLLLLENSYKQVKILTSIIATLCKVKIFKNIYSVFRRYKDNPVFLLKAMLFGVIHQSLYVLLFMSVTMAYTKTNIEWSLLLTVLPIGIVTTAIPLAPGGIGVGHVAFDKLFSLIGISNGANIFNIVVLSQMALNLFGAIPYIMLRQEILDFNTKQTPQAEAVRQ